MTGTWTSRTAVVPGGLFVFDRVDLSTPRRAEAVRNVPGTLDVFDSHFPRMPVLPGVIVLGCLTRLCARLLAAETGSAWSLVSVGRVRYRHFVQPGDALELVADVIEVDDGSARCTAKASVEGRAVTTARSVVLGRGDAS